MNDITLHLESYPSFNKLDVSAKTHVLEDMSTFVEKGKKEKWLIDYDELTIKTIIGQGAQSLVFDSLWRNSLVAVKKPKNKKLITLKDLMKEIEILSSLRHPRLVQFMGVAFDNNNHVPFIIMEKIPGTTLQDVLDNKYYSFKRGSKTHIIQQLIDVLLFLHNCKPPIIYRDLKPDNIMLDIQQQNIKLTDFGLSRFMPETDEYYLTGETGTVRYMAPEVYKKEPYDLNVDVYSLGLIIYYLSAREKPFIHYNTETIGVYFKTPDLLFSTQKVKQKNLRTLINHCIEKNPKLRWNIDAVSKYMLDYSIKKEYQSCSIA
tara:strand:- start:35 stop:988 length:954 start_codon:yes stop_codon:yes gene_type:complete